jgi:hypothetical protein
MFAAPDARYVVICGRGTENSGSFIVNAYQNLENGMWYARAHGLVENQVRRPTAIRAVAQMLSENGYNVGSVEIEPIN